MKPLRHQVDTQDGEARQGRLWTRRGVVETPAFMPVGTAGSVKGMLPREVSELGAQIILSNTYHLHVRPGETLIAALGGLHRFCAWDGPILTDSGGYQVYSLAARCKLDDDGVTFQDHVEGSQRRLTPEISIQIQERLASDIMMALDDCTGAPEDRAQAERAMLRTNSWLKRNLAARTDLEAALFGIVQGGIFADLRHVSLQETAALPFDGIALGGVSVGETDANMAEVIEQFGPRLPAERPRYLMGIGRPQDLLRAIAAGFDMFDCVLPTRHGRTAQLFTSRGTLSIRNARFRDDAGPVDPDCGCPICLQFSRAYLRHLYTSGEMLAARAGTIHNLFYYLQLMRQAREAIAARRFDEFHRRCRSNWEQGLDD